MLMIFHSAQDTCGSRRSRILAITHARCLCLILCVVCLCGCKPPPRPPLNTNSENKSQRKTSRQVDEKPKFDTQPENIDLRFAIEDPQDLWDAYYFNGEQIGYSHIASEISESKKEVTYTVTERIYVRRGEAVQDHLLTQTSVETLSGRLLSFAAELVVNNERTTTNGRVSGNELLVTTVKGDNTSERVIPWNATYRGLLGLQQFLRETPPKIGNSHTIAVLAPMFYDLGQIQIKAIGSAAVPLLSGKPVPATELETVSSIAGSNMLQTFLWIDSEGNLLKSYIPSLQLTILRVDRETAQSFAIPQQDVLAQLAIPVTGTIPDPANAGKVGYTVGSLDQSELAAIKAFPGQKFVSIQPSEARVAVDFVAPDPFPELIVESGDREPNPLIQSDDSRIIALAQSENAPENSLALAQQLAQSVHRHLSQKNFDNSFLSAATAFTQRGGDCTEHAVLVAALCRSRGIPARVAMGLVYTPGESAPEMRFHMWTMAQIDQGWVHLDAMHSSGLAAADRITLLTDNLASGTEYSAATVVGSLVGKVQIEIAKKIVPRSAPEVEPKTADPLELLLEGVGPTIPDSTTPQP